MMILDTVITLAIVIGAAAYLYRSLAKSKKGSGCSCSSGGGCCGGDGKTVESHCGAAKH